MIKKDTPVTAVVIVQMWDGESLREFAKEHKWDSRAEKFDELAYDTMDNISDYLDSVFFFPATQEDIADFLSLKYPALNEKDLFGKVDFDGKKVEVINHLRWIRQNPKRYLRYLISKAAYALNVDKFVGRYIKLFRKEML